MSKKLPKVVYDLSYVQHVYNEAIDLGYLKGANITNAYRDMSETRRVLQPITQFNDPRIIKILLAPNPKTDEKLIPRSERMAQETQRFINMFKTVFENLKELPPDAMEIVERHAVLTACVGDLEVALGIHTNGNGEYRVNDKINDDWSEARGKLVEELQSYNVSYYDDVIHNMSLLDAGGRPTQSAIKSIAKKAHEITFDDNGKRYRTWREVWVKIREHYQDDTPERQQILKWIGEETTDYKAQRKNEKNAFVAFKKACSREWKKPNFGT